MGSSGKSLALLIAVVLLTSLVALQLTFAEATTVETNSSAFPLPDENASIFLLNGASFAESDYYVAHNTSDGYVPSSWLFAVFSTGNGSTGLTVSAHDCNVTFTSYNYYQQNTEGYNFKVDTWLNYTVTGTGIQSLNYPALYNSNNSNPIVYIDGKQRQQGDGWNWANFGVTVTGASSKVSIHQEDTLYLPPRNSPHLQPVDYALYLIPLASVIAAVTAILLLYRGHRKNKSATVHAI